MIEEGFLDVFASLVYGGGWMDRAETTFRECNWALVSVSRISHTHVYTTMSPPLNPALGRIQGIAHPKTANSAVR